MSEPFRNPALPRSERVADLLGRLTLEEKFSLFTSNWPAIDRVGVPAMRWGGECLHGLVHTGAATVFPAAIQLAGTFDPDLVRKVADAISTEARAKYHSDSWARGTFLSISFYTPNINLFRDPRWGRGQETYGEDPFLAGRMGRAFVEGLQGPDPEHLKTAACAKHYAVHSGPEAIRTSFNAQVPRKLLRETYLPHFRQLVESRVAMVMGAYNAVDGAPCCGSPFLLEEILREEWGFDGFVVSDAGAIAAFHRGHPDGARADRPEDAQWARFLVEMAGKKGHAVTMDPVESAALAVNSGCDMSIGPDMEAKLIRDAVARGLVTPERIDLALGRILDVAFRLGVFDPADAQRHAHYPASAVQSPRHLKLAREAATRGAVLLKNNGLLPLRPEHRVIAVSGPTAADAEVLLGNFYRGMSARLVTIVEGLAATAPQGTVVTYLRGTELVQPKLFESSWHVGLAEWADVAVAVIGNSPLMEGEDGECISTKLGGDRDRMDLPEVQLAYVRQLKEQSRKPLLVIVTGGSPIIMPEVHDLADAVLFAGYPGEQGGLAIGDLVFGKANPSGRLPFTVPMRVDQVPDFADYSMRGRTYRYWANDEDPPLYPFGYGLSYSRFSYGEVVLSADRVRVGRGLKATIAITNEGDRAGEEVVQLYVANHADADGPRCNLADFQRVALAPGQTKFVRFKLTPAMLQHVDDAGNWVIAPGEFTVTIGPCAPGPRGEALGAAAAASARFVVTA